MSILQNWNLRVCLNAASPIESPTPPTEEAMNIKLTINSEVKTFEISPKDRLLDVLRRNGYFGVKHGCDDGSCGACAVLIDGKSINSCTLLAAQVQGKSIMTIEGLGVAFDQPDDGPTHGWTATCRCIRCSAPSSRRARFSAATARPR